MEAVFNLLSRSAYVLTEQSLNGLLIGTIVAALVWMAMRLLPHSNARTLHQVWWVTLVVILALPLILPVLGPALADLSSRAYDRATAMVAGPDLEAAPENDQRTRTVVSSDITSDATTHPTNTSTGTLHTTVTLPATDDEADPITLSAVSQWANKPQSEVIPNAPTEQSSGNIWAALPGMLAIGFAMVWLFGAGFLLMRLVLAHARLVRIKRRAAIVTHPIIDDVVAAMRSAGLKRPVWFAESDAVTVPMLAGVIRPVVLMPRGLVMKLSKPELEAVAVHELAHLRRRDDITKLIQKIIEACLFFHPAVRFIGRELELLREVACDDWVVAHTQNATAYARCLTRLVRLTSWSGASLAPGALLSRKQIFARFDRLLNRRVMVDTGFGTRVFGLSIALVVSSVLATASLAPALTLPGQPLDLVVEGSVDTQSESTGGTPAAGNPDRSVGMDGSSDAYSVAETSPGTTGASSVSTVSVSTSRRVIDHTDKVATRRYSDRRQPARHAEVYWEQRDEHEKARAALAAERAALTREVARQASAQRAQWEEMTAQKVQQQALQAELVAAAPRAQRHNGSWLSGLFGGSHSVEWDNGRNMSATWSDDDRKLSIRVHGDVVFTDDEGGIASLGDDGYLLIKERRDGERRELEAEADDEGAVYHYWVEGKKRPFDAEAREWLAGIIPDILRNTGLGAEARVERLYDTGGVDAVLREVSLMESDYVRSLYIRHLAAQRELTEDEVVRVLRTIDEEIDSDFERANSLGALGETIKAHPEVLDEYVTAVRGIDSDFEVRRTLQQLHLDSQLSDDVILAVCRAADEMDSDFERAELLIEIAPQCNRTESLGRAYLRTAKTIDSDFELRRALSAIYAAGDLPPATVRELVEVSKSIDSDYEKAEMLTSMSRDRDYTEELLREMIMATMTLDSDFEQARALSAMRMQPLGSDSLYDAMLDALRGISSDFEKAGLLVELAPNAVTSTDRTRLYVHAVDDIASDFERARALGKLITENDLSDEQLMVVLHSVGRMHSDHEKAQLLSRVVRRCAESETLEDPFMEAVETIQGEYTRDQLYAKFLRSKRASR